MFSLASLIGLDLISVLFLMIGIVGLFVSYFVICVPFIGAYRSILNLGSCFLLIIGSFYQGEITKEKYYNQKIVEMQSKIDLAQEQSRHSNEIIDLKVKDRINETKGKVNDTKKIITKYKTVIDSNCKLSDDARMFYNRSINNGISSSTPRTTTTSTKSK